MVNGNGQLVLGRPIYGLYIYKDLGIIESEKDIPAYYDQQGNKNTLHSMNKSYPYSVGTRMIQDMNQDGKIDDEDRYYAGLPCRLLTGDGQTRLCGTVSI